MLMNKAQMLIEKTSSLTLVAFLLTFVPYFFNLSLKI